MSRVSKRHRRNGQFIVSGTRWLIRTLGEKFVQFNMADKTVAPSFGREQSMDKKFAGCKIEMTPLLIVP